LLPIGRQLKRVEPTRWTDDDSLRTAQENTEAFPFDRRVKAADYGTILCAPTLSEIDGFNDLFAWAGFRTKNPMQALIEKFAISVAPQLSAGVLN
jgi:hypothetical protein